MPRYKRPVFLIMIGVCICLSGSAQPFTAVYSFANVSKTTGSLAPGPLPQVEGLTLGTFTAFGLPDNPNASGRFSFTGWPQGATNADDNYGNYTGALSPFSFYEVALEVQSGYTLNLESMDFSVRRSGTGIRNYCVRSDLDGYNNNLPAEVAGNGKLAVIPDHVFFWSFDATSTTSEQDGSRVVFGEEYHALTGSLHLRFYAWNAEANGGSFSIDNVTLKGTVSDSTALTAFVTEVGSKEECLVTIADQAVFINCDFIRAELHACDGTLLKTWKAAHEGNALSLPGLGPGLYFIVISRASVTQVIKLLIVAKG